jgi:hypothetical protein
VCSSNACDRVGMQLTALTIFPVRNLVFFSRAQLLQKEKKESAIPGDVEDAAFYTNCTHTHGGGSVRCLGQ